MLKKLAREKVSQQLENIIKWKEKIKNNKEN